MRKTFKVICLIFLGVIFLSVSSYVFGKTYVWTDKNGNTQFTDNPPPPSQVMKPQRRNLPPKEYQKIKRKKVESPTVELYITSWCPYCKKAMEYFDSKDIRYKVYDIEKDKQAAIRKKVLDKQNGVPFAIVNGQGIHGYVPELYAEALKKK